MARLKFRSASKQKRFNPGQVSTAGITQLRNENNRILQGMQNNFQARKEQQERDRKAMKENAALEEREITRDRKIELENQRLEEAGLAQELANQKAQFAADRKASDQIFSGLADFSATIGAVAKANHARMIKDQTEEANARPIDHLVTQFVDAYDEAEQTLIQGGISADVDTQEFSVENAESRAQTLLGIISNPALGDVQNRVIQNRALAEIYPRLVNRALRSTDENYTLSDGTVFSGFNATKNVQQMTAVLSQIEKQMFEQMGLNTAQPGRFVDGMTKVQAFKKAMIETADKNETEHNVTILKQQAEDHASANTTQGFALAFTLMKNLSKEEAHNFLMEKGQNLAVDLNQIDQLDLLGDGRRYSEVWPNRWQAMLSERRQNEAKAIRADKQIREAQNAQFEYENADSIFAAYKADWNDAEAVTLKRLKDSGGTESAYLKLIKRSAKAEIIEEESQKLTILQATGGLDQGVLDSFQSQEVRERGEEILKAQEEQKYGATLKQAYKGYEALAQDLLDLEIGPNTKDSFRVVELTNKLLERHVQLYGRIQGYEATAEAVTKEAREGRDGLGNKSSPFYAETQPTGALKFKFKYEKERDDRTAQNQTLDVLMAHPDGGANLERYVYQIETTAETETTLRSAQTPGGPIYSKGLQYVRNKLNAADPNGKQYTLTELFNEMQRVKTKLEGKQHRQLTPNDFTEAVDAQEPEVIRLIQLSNQHRSHVLRKRAAVTATNSLPLHLRSNMGGGGAMQPLRNLVLRGEGGFTSANRGKAGDSLGGIPGLDKMTVADWKYLYKQGWNALGGPQFIEDTFIGAVNRLGLSDDTVMTGAVQLQLFDELILGGVKRPRLSAYLNGTSDDLHGALEDISLEFASVANPNTGITSYPDIGGNAASITSSEMAQVLKELRAARLSSQTPQTPQAPQTQQTPQQPRNRIGGGRPPGVDVGLGGPTSPETDPYYYVMGDSVALGATGTPRYRNNPKGTDNSDAQVSRSPQEVLAHLKKYKGYLKDATVKLSTGALNRPTTWRQATIAMFDFLIAEGVKDVKLIGFPTTPKYDTMRAVLDDLARTYGFPPPKHYTPGPDGVHPLDYKELSRF